jgi:hypothetical protein
MKKYLLLLLLPGFTLLQYCSSSKKAKAPEPVVSKVTFDDHVKPLVNSKCGPCHTIGNKTHIGNYKEASEHADEIIRRISLTPADKDFMPAKHDKLPDSVIAVFAKWKADGLLEKANP